MFYFNPDLAANDLMEEGDEAFDSYIREDEDEEMEYKDIELDVLENEASEVDGTGTVAPDARFQGAAPALNGSLESPGTEDVV